MQLSLSQSRRVRLTVTYVLLGIWTVFCLFPIYWMVITSIKLPIAVFQGPKYFPWIDFKPTLDAWVFLFTGKVHDQVIKSWINSAILAIFSATFAVAIGAMAGYALSRYRYRVPLLKWSNGNIAFWVISQRMLPPVVVILPFIIMYHAVGLIDTHVGMILAYTVFNLPFVVWILRDFFAGLPIDLEESAFIDGASRMQAFLRIVLPLSTPGLIATWLFCLMFSWNDYLFALMLTFRRAQTLSMYIAGEGSQVYGPQWWYLSALSLTAIVPMIILALLVERYITKGLVVGAIK
jgi:multiple sugar transport system permease protein